jgi:predicted ATPase with chaperone activity
MNTGQRDAFSAAERGHSFFLSGAAGTGKIKVIVRLQYTLSL